MAPVQELVRVHGMVLPIVQPPAQSGGEGDEEQEQGRQYCIIDPVGIDAGAGAGWRHKNIGHFEYELPPCLRGVLPQERYEETMERMNEQLAVAVRRLAPTVGARVVLQLLALLLCVPLVLVLARGDVEAAASTVPSGGNNTAAIEAAAAATPNGTATAARGAVSAPDGCRDGQCHGVVRVVAEAEPLLTLPLAAVAAGGGLACAVAVGVWAQFRTRSAWRQLRLDLQLECNRATREGGTRYITGAPWLTLLLLRRCCWSTLRIYCQRLRERDFIVTTNDDLRGGDGGAWQALRCTGKRSLTCARSLSRRWGRGGPRCTPVLAVLRIGWMAASRCCVT
jgi:hypothetical protein